MAWLAGYSERKRLPIAGTAVGAQANYQIPYTVHGDGGVDAADLIHLDRKADNQLKDIRFTKSDESTLLDHWKEINYQYESMGIADFVGTIEFIRPGAFYYNGVTYIAYVGGAGADVNKIKILTYNHSTHTFSAAQIVYSGANVTNHDYPRPCIVVDNSGYIHVFYENNTQDTAAQLYHRVSTNPEDISAWQDGNVPADATNCVLPNVLIDSAGALYLIYSDARSDLVGNYDWITLSIRKSVDEGVTWANPIGGYLVDFGNNIWLWPMSAWMDVNDRIHLSYNQGPAITENLKDVFYIVGETGGTVWKKADGTVIATPASEATSDQVYDSAVDGDETRVTDIQLLPGSTHPWMIYAAQTAGSNMEWYLAKHDGVNWSSVKIEEAGNSGNTDEAEGLIEITDSNNASVYLHYINDGTAHAPIRVYTTANGGADWSLTNVISPTAAGGPERVGNAQPEFKFFWMGLGYTACAYGKFSVSTVWVEVDTIPVAPGTGYIYIYYGNSTAIDASNGANTFILFDDAERGADGDAVGGSWTVTNGSVRISTDYNIGRELGRWTETRGIKFVGAAAIPQAHVAQVAGTGYAIRTRYWHENTVQEGPYFYHGNGTRIALTIINVFEEVTYYDGATHATGATITADTWQLLELRNFNWGAFTYDIISNDVVAKAGATELVDAGANGVIRIQHTDPVAGEDIYIDDLLVRNYANPEPVPGVPDAPESLPSFVGGGMAHKLVSVGFI